MTSFTSLLSSISGQPQAPQPKPATASRPVARPSQTSANGAVLQPSNAAAGVKRKAEEQAAVPKPKVFRTEMNVPVRPPGQQATAKPALNTPAPKGEYRGTARAAGAVIPTKPVSRPFGKSVATSATSSSTQPTAANDANKPKRGFASLMEKAKAAQEAAKAVGSSTIKHKPVEKLTKRDRQRMQEEATKQKPGNKTGKLGVKDRSRSGTPVDAKAAGKKVPMPTYKGTMKKPVERQAFEYKGTMRKADPGAPKAKAPAQKRPEGKYNGYASWSDLDDAEDDEEGDYDSESDMDAGFDDMESEERMALAAAKKEDQEALAEEEAHKRAKEERKKKLMALSKSAASRKKY